MKKILLLLALALSLNAAAQDDIEVINIENRAVRAFLADSTYWHNNDYKVSVAAKYKDVKYNPELEKPNGKKVTWQPTTQAMNIEEIRITVSENSDYSNAVTHNPSKLNVSTYTIRNMEPNKTYYYKVEEFCKDGRKTEVAKGVFRTEGRLRMIEVRGSHNVRDIGGWPSMIGEGSTIKYGYLFRSGNLDKITAEGRHDFATNLNVGGELDLRAGSKLTSSKLGEDKGLLVQGHWSGSAGMMNNNKVYPKDLSFIVKHLKEGKGVDWHCAIGCDRCGALSFLLEGLLGMNEQDLARDYELSNFAGHDRPRNVLSSMIRNVRKYGTGDDKLSDCFYKYWLSIGANKEEMDYFINFMLDQGTTEVEEDDGTKLTFDDGFGESPNTMAY